MRVWTVYDERYLRRLQIAVDEPPAPLPRFQAMAAKDGEYEVIDRLISFRCTHVIAATFDDPKSVAEAIAYELNQKYESKV